MSLNSESSGHARVMDLAPLAGDVGGMANALAVLDGFLGSVEAWLPEMEAAAEAGNWDEARRIAHGIKGSARTFHARRVEAAAQQAEERAHARDARAFALALQDVRACYDELLAARPSEGAA